MIPISPIRGDARALAAEAAGTAVLVGVGTGAIVASSGQIPLVALAVIWAIALLVPAAVFVARSGAHFNPAISVALWAAGRFPGNRLAPYVAAQCLGAFAGSAVLLLTLGGGSSLGAATPNGVDLSGVLALETIATLGLGSMVVLAGRWYSTVGPIAVALPSAAVGIATYVIGPRTGSSLNPARYLAPAVLSGSYPDAAGYLLAAFAGAAVGVYGTVWLLAELDARKLRRPTRVEPGPGGPPAGGDGKR